MILRLKNITEIDEQIKLINKLYPEDVAQKFGGKGCGNFIENIV